LQTILKKNCVLPPKIVFLPNVVMFTIYVGVAEKAFGLKSGATTFSQMALYRTTLGRKMLSKITLRKIALSRLTPISEKYKRIHQNDNLQNDTLHNDR